MEFFELDRIKAKEEIKIGLVIYCVYALGKNSFIEEETVLSEPYLYLFSDGTNNGLVFDSQHPNKFTKNGYYEDHCYLDSFNMNDSGRKYPRFNDHKAFYSRDSAEKYLENCKILNIGAPTKEEIEFQNMVDDFWDEMYARVDDI